jgi:hypothetical protein
MTLSKCEYGFGQHPFQLSPTAPTTALVLILDLGITFGLGLFDEIFVEYRFSQWLYICL